MIPRFASLLAGLALALTASTLPLPNADPSAPLAVPHAGTAAVAPLAAPAACPAPDAAAMPAVEAAEPAWDLFAPQPAAANCQQMCDQLCAPLQGRCKAGSCFCLRDPL